MKSFKNLYACSNCPVSFSKPKFLVSHVETKHADNPSEARNEGTGKKFQNKSMILSPKSQNSRNVENEQFRRSYSKIKNLKNQDVSEIQDSSMNLKNKGDTGIESQEMGNQIFQISRNPKTHIARDKTDSKIASKIDRQDLVNVGNKKHIDKTKTGIVSHNKSKPNVDTSTESSSNDEGPESEDFTSDESSEGGHISMDNDDEEYSPGMTLNRGKKKMSTIERNKRRKIWG